MCGNIIAAGKNNTPIASHTQGEHANNITTEAILFSI
jgi:hypothetical protein